MYSNKILELFKNPANAGGLQGANGTGKYIDEACGDQVKIYLKINEKEEIDEARFKTMGAVGTIVASSALCQAIIGMTIQEAKSITKEQIIVITGKFPEDKEYTIGFVLNALNLAIENYYEKLEKESKETKKQKTKKMQDLKYEEEVQNPVEEKPVASEAMENIAKAEAEGLISEEENNKASNLVEEAKSYTPYVSTRILSNEDLKLIESKREANKPKKEKSVSSAKAMFDAMFEE